MFAWLKKLLVRSPNHPCPICDKEMEPLPGGWRCYDMNGEFFPATGHEYWMDVVEHSQWHYYAVQGTTYHIVVYEDHVSLGYDYPVLSVASLTGKSWQGWDFSTTDIEFDPKNPQPVIEKIRLLEAFRQ